MSDNVVDFTGITTLDIQPTRILAKAAGAKLKTCVVVGWDDAGELYFASSVAGGPEVIWLFEVAKKRLLEIEI